MYIAPSNYSHPQPSVISHIPFPHPCPFVLSCDSLSLIRAIGLDLFFGAWWAQGDSHFSRLCWQPSRSRVRGKPRRPLPSPWLTVDRAGFGQLLCVPVCDDCVVPRGCHFTTILPDIWLSHFSPTLLPWCPLSLRGWWWYTYLSYLGLSIQPPLILRTLNSRESWHSLQFIGNRGVFWIS